MQLFESVIHPQSDSCIGDNANEGSIQALHPGNELRTRHSRYRMLLKRGD